MFLGSYPRSSCYGTMASAACLESWDEGSIPPYATRGQKRKKKKNPCPIRKISRERKSLIADSNISHLTKDTILGQRVFKLVFYHISKFD